MPKEGTIQHEAHPFCWEDSLNATFSLRESSLLVKNSKNL